MKFEPVPLSEADGKILGHDIAAMTRTSSNVKCRA